MAQNRTDREIIEALLRQMDPQTYPAGAPDLPAQLGAWLEGLGQSLESSLQGESGLERFAELIPRWLAANPAQNVGALLQMRQPEVEQLKTMATQAAAQPVETAKAVGRAGLEAVKDPMGTAEGLSALEALGAGKALSSLAKMGTRLRGPDLIESVMPEAKVERPKTRTERSQRLPEEDAEKARLDRAAQQGFNIDAFHGTKGDISAFDPGLRSSTTGATSARKGFFFSADPETASAYAIEADPVVLGRMSLDEFKARKKVYTDKQLELAASFTEIDDKINEAIGVNESSRVLNAIDRKISDQLNERSPLDTKIGRVLEEEDLLGFDTKGEAAGAIVRHDDWASRWDVVNPNTVQMIESWKKAWKREEDQRDLEVGKLLKQREVAQENLDLAYEAHEPYADKHFPELQLIVAQLEDLEGKIDRGHLEPMGDNIMPVKLKLQNPLEHDFGSESYREVSYHDLLEQAQREGRDGAIFRNTYDGGDLTDIYVVFDPSQIRSRYAMFDPEKSASGEVIAGAAPLVLPLGAGAAAEAYMANEEGRDFSWSNMAGPAMLGMAGVPSARLRKGLVQRSKVEANQPGKTDLGQIAATFKDKRFDWPEGARVLDLGGGKSDKAKELMAERGVTMDVIDPIQRSESHNSQILDAFEENPADIVTINNVLNVIQEPSLRKQALRGAKALIKPGGEVRIKIYEGSGSGKGSPTSTGSWQENRRARDYLSEVESVFGKGAVSVRGSYLIAREQ